MTNASSVIDQRLLAEAIDWPIDGCASAPTADLVLNQILFTLADHLGAAPLF